MLCITSASNCCTNYLQGRLFSYADTHRHRLGANYHQIPVNCPYAARARNYQRDGPMTADDNQGLHVQPAFQLVMVVITDGLPTDESHFLIKESMKYNSVLL